MATTRLVRLAALPLLALLVANCTGDALVPRWGKADKLAREAGWAVERLPAGPFLLTTARSPVQPESARLTVYIEGDGLAFLGLTRVSPDPTPLDPVGLRLALRHGGGNVAWVGRPCQYVPQDVRQPACDSALWTSARYGAEAVAAVSEAIDRLKARYAARDLVLAGYSGGGALAVLLAARRTDVAGVITVAAPLDVVAWARADGLAPLSASFNPADAAATVANVPQVHFAGGRDDVVGAAPAHAYMARLPADHRAELRVVPEFGHECCWARDWNRLLPPMAK